MEGVELDRMEKRRKKFAEVELLAIKNLFFIDRALGFVFIAHSLLHKLCLTSRTRRAAAWRQ
jgi:hypothetical protein